MTAAGLAALARSFTGVPAAGVSAACFTCWRHSLTAGVCSEEALLAARSVRGGIACCGVAMLELLGPPKSVERSKRASFADATAAIERGDGGGAVAGESSKLPPSKLLLVCCV